MELDHLSYSSISTWQMCGASWKFRYIEKPPQVLTSTNLVFGSAFHGAIETFLVDRVTEEKPRSLLMCWNQSWEKESTTLDPETEERKLRQDVDWGLDTPETLCNEGVRILSHPDVQQGILSIAPLAIWKAEKQIEVFIEQKVELKVPGVPIPIVGYIDIITADGVPGDFKTSSKSWSADKAEDEIQTLFYLAALNQAGFEVKDWRFRHYVFVKTKTPQFQMLEHTHNPAQLMWLFKMIQNVWKGIDAGVFPESPGSWKCNPKYCEYWALCRGKFGG